MKTSSMQKLLYGKTLKPELFGKNIVGALVQEMDNSRPKPSVLLTDEEAVFLGADIEDFPVLQIRAPSSESEVGDKTTVERISTATGEMVMRWRPGDKEQIKDILPKLINVDLVEPFQRVRRLLDEMGGKRTDKNES